MTDIPPQPNIGKPAFAKGGTGPRKLYAIGTTVAFAFFWVYLFFTLSGALTEHELRWYHPALCIAGGAVGFWARWRMNRES